MPTVDDAVLRRAVRAVRPGAEVTEVRGLRDGGSPWLVCLGADRIVVRVGDAGDPGPLRTEAAALRLAARHRIPVPRLLATDFDGDPPLVVTSVLPGSSDVPRHRPVDRLRALGAAAAWLHAIPLTAGPDLPRRERPIAGVDFAALRREHPPQPLLARAEQRIADRPAGGPDVLVHGDLWQGNTMWTVDGLSGLIDWDCAGAGQPGIDLGSLRCDAAMAHGLPAAQDVLDGWTRQAGRPAADVAYWDVVAALSTPPDIDWFAPTIAAQGRPDLTQLLLRQRRDAFLAAALQSLDRHG